MSKKYKLRQALLMPGDKAIVLPIGYEVVFCEGKYIGEGGWFFASHGVENNKLHWEEVTDTERIEVSHFCEHDTLKGNRCDSWFYQFCLSNPITPDKFPSIKEAIEFVLNNEPQDVKVGDYIFKFQAVQTEKTYTQEQMDNAIKHAFRAARKMSRFGDGWQYEYSTREDYLNSLSKNTAINPEPTVEKKEQSKDWEIVRYGYCQNNEGKPEEQYIYSVRRLSDNTIWEVGEETTSDAGYLYKPIKRFFEKEGVMYAQFDEGYGSNDGCLGLNALKKLPSKPQPLFVTNDNVPIFDGYSGELWRVFTGNSSFESWKPYNLGLPSFPVDGEKYFSTKDGADEYVLMNKPCLSLVDIGKVVGGDVPIRFIDELRQIAKSKSTNH